MKRVKSGKGPAGAEDDAGDGALQDSTDAEDSPAKALVSLKEGLSGTWNEKYNSPQKTPNWKASGNPASEVPYRSSKRSRLFCEEEEKPLNTRSPKRNPRTPIIPQKTQATLNTPVKKSSQKIGYRLRNLLKLPKAHKWCIYEWFYSNIDKPLFEGDNDFCVCLKESFPNLKTRKLTRVEWGKIRRLMGKPRRCSAAFFEEERAALEQKRQKIRLLQQRKVADVSQFKDLPDEIPLSLVIGTKVTARLRGQHDGLFTGQIDAVDTQHSTYRITFDRNGLGTHTIPDYEVLSYEPHETMPIAAFGQKQRPSRTFMSPPRSNYPPSVLSPITGTDPFLGQPSWKNKMSSADNNDTIGGFPVEFLDQVMSPKTGTAESRNPPFTEAENEALARKVLENYSKLYGNCSAMISAHNKKEIWKSIARHVSAAGTTRRTPEKCKKRYSDLKIKVKNKMANKVRHRRQRGGVPSLTITYSTSESLMRKIINLATVREDPNEADTNTESGKQTEAIGEPQHLNNASVGSSGVHSENVKSEARKALETSPAHPTSTSSVTDDVSHGTSGSRNSAHRCPPVPDENLGNSNPLGQHSDFNVKLLENVRECNTQLFGLMRAVTDLKEQIQTTNTFLGQIAQNLRNIHETLRERNTVRHHPQPTQPSTSGACVAPAASQSDAAGEPTRSASRINQKESLTHRTIPRGKKRAGKPRPKSSAQATTSTNQRDKSTLRFRKRPAQISASRPVPKKKLSKILMIKKEHIKQLRDMNTEAEKLKSYSAPINIEFQRRYATIVLDLEQLNKDLNKVLHKVQQYCYELAPDQGLQPANQPTSMRQRCEEQAQEMVRQANNTSTGQPCVQNESLTDLISRLTSILLQITCLAEGGDLNSFEFKSLTDSINDIKSSISPSNISCFQNNVEIHVAHIQSGLSQMGNLHAFSANNTNRD